LALDDGAAIVAKTINIFAKAVSDSVMAGDVPFAQAIHIRLASLALDSRTFLGVECGARR
jgi:hypothetical protein